MFSYKFGNNINKAKLKRELIGKSCISVNMLLFSEKKNCQVIVKYFFFFHRIRFLPYKAIFLLSIIKNYFKQHTVTNMLLFIG